MSVDDLAIDVGLAVNTDEYDVFVACVQNILDCGCKYNEETMDNIIQKCQTSKLDIAAQVIRECRQPAQMYRKSRSHKKWWETYQSKSQRIRKYRSPERRSPERRSSERRSSERRSSERRSSECRSPERRIPMNLEFKPEPKKMNLEFKKKSTVKYVRRYHVGLVVPRRPSVSGQVRRLFDMFAPHKNFGAAKEDQTIVIGHNMNIVARHLTMNIVARLRIETDVPHHLPKTS